MKNWQFWGFVATAWAITANVTHDPYLYVSVITCAIMFAYNILKESK